MVCPNFVSLRALVSLWPSLMKNGLIILCFIAQTVAAQKNDLAVIAYYSGSNTSEVEKFPIKDLTHIIFSFCYLRGNQLIVANKTDASMIRKLVSLKKKHPRLKIMLSLGGWGGCKTCSDVFSTDENRLAFAESVKQLCDKYGTDGIDIDWEYPAIEGFPGHPYKPEDRDHFTALLMDLRKSLGNERIISFAAGGFDKYIEQSVDWGKAMQYADFVNVMTYDLVNGYSTKTGHHTPLYSNSQQTLSIDNAVNNLVSRNVPRNKIIIGAAMYARVWKDVHDTANGLYQSGIFLENVSFKNFSSKFSANDGFRYYWDTTAKAPWMYSAEKKQFATFDDTTSMRLKTRYVIDNGLGGIMFWQLTLDKYKGGLLDAIKKENTLHTDAR
jgi:chitinase